MKYSINICRSAANTSTDFENNNSKLKKEYLIKNIKLYNEIVHSLSTCRGSFGTGYPFYALKKDFSGRLPIIEEQIRYNEELLDAVNNSRHLEWTCGRCLSENCDKMPDLKQICKPCPAMDDELKPRKVINRLPDIDMWTVCNSDDVLDTKERLIELFEKNNMYTSDVDPLKTMKDLREIVKSLKNNEMPQKNLPIDAHIIEYETLYSLISSIPNEIEKSIEKDKAPYLPIHPHSYRKKWQHDDMAYNFVQDFLYTFHEFDFDKELQERLDKTRKELVKNFSIEDLYECAISNAADSVKRRQNNRVLEKRLIERLESWKK